MSEPVDLDPVRVRMAAALAEQVPQLRLGDLLTRRETERGQAAAHPAPYRDTGLLLGGTQRRAGRTASITDNRLAQVVAAHRV
ncbi:hypothetical protein [Streptomyces rubiginosohelvolus]|uniref:hypothetical protein n=1 Tax=Streptomyces rubiginosohelvolus TaxID=67362 RepID=UPI0037FF9C53